jgi:non-heme chloroperoxidase
MTTVTIKDGVEIFYKDWGPKDAQPVVFHHGWPLSSDDWDNQMLFLVGNGYRVVGIDRRGHGRSTQVPDGHDMDHGGTGLIGSKTIVLLRSAGHHALAAAPETGVNTVTGEGLAGSAAWRRRGR